MKALIYSHHYVIGHANLQPGDVAMGGVYGTFVPTAEYYDRVQQTVWEFTAGPSPAYEKWQALRLNAQLENGYFLFPMGGYELIDSPAFPHEPKQIYLAGVAADIIEDFIEIDPPRTFVEEPWEPLTIQEKLALEAEYGRETGRNPKPIFVANSPLSPSALCKYGPTDDVLFSIQPANSTQHFALVHLTWSGKHEVNAAFPRTEFFSSFAEFKLARMYPDRTEWES